jgi:paraquat-inducible protein A
VRTSALLLAALVLYIPANVLPVMYTRLLGSEAESTILEGVVEFWRSGSWDIAVLIFAASVAVPCTKFLAIALLLLDQKFPIGSRVGKTRLLKLVEHIGYWSMLDVLVVALVTALIQFRALGVAEPRPGIVFFGAVVVLTMLAAMSFDSRLAWQRQVQRGGQYNDNPAVASRARDRAAAPISAGVADPDRRLADWHRHAGGIVALQWPPGLDRIQQCPGPRSGQDACQL